MLINLVNFKYILDQTENINLAMVQETCVSLTYFKEQKAIINLLVSNNN